MFRTAFHRTMATGKTKKSMTIRRVITCDMASASNAPAPVPIKLSSDVLLWGTSTESVQIEGRSYEFIHMDKRALEMHALQVQHVGPMGAGSGAGVLVFYTSPLGNAVIPPDEVDMLEVFYDVAGGQIYPMIVVLRDCNNEERATWECQSALTSRHRNIQAYFTTLSNQELNEMIGRLCIDHVEVKSPTIIRAYAVTKQWVVTTLEAVIPRRKHSKVGNPGISPTT